MRDDTRSRGGGDPSAPRLLKLVHPAPPPKPQRRRGTARLVEDVFDAAQTARLRLAIDNARKKLGGWQRLADAVGVHVDTLRGAGRDRTITAGVAYRFVRATGTTIEALLASTLRVVPREDGAA